jgi:ATP-binding cassette subfamily F protein 3
VTLVTLERVERRFGDLEVLTGASLRVDESERIGVVGDNGSGKTTLIRILAGVDEADRGARNPRKGLRVAYAEQVPHMEPGMTVLEQVMRGDGTFEELEQRIRQLEHDLAECPGDERLLETYGELQGAFEAGGGYERLPFCERVLDGLGFSAVDRQKDVAVLSGGERTRVALATLMTAPADLLILDEPTNHLDLEGIAFVEDFVQRYPGAVVAISHDRRFLNAFAKRIVEIDDGTATSFSGNFDAWQKQKDQQLLADARAFKNQQAFIEKETEYIRRNMAGRMSRQAKGRLKRLQRLERISRPKGEGRGMKLRFAGDVRGQRGQTMLEAEGLHLRIGDRSLLEDASFRLLHGETVALLGRNGSGKSTLLTTMAGRRAPNAGTIKRAHGVEIGTFEQDVHHLPHGVTVLEALRTLDPLAPEKELRDHLALFLFSGDDVEASVDDLSGGEKQRLSLARLTRSSYDLLCLDEPTNHLDIAACEGLEEALRAFPGAVLLVSHDRDLLDAVADRILWLEDARLRSFDGDLQRCLATVTAERASKHRPRPTPAPKTAPAVESRKAVATERIRNPMMFAKLEARIMALEEELERTRAEMASEECWRDPGALRTAQAREAKIQAELDEAYARWENWQ